MIHILNCANPRLSDEEPDLLEQDEGDSDGTPYSPEGWTPWTSDDLLDIRRIIQSKMPKKQRIVMEAFLSGQNNESIGVTEKFWRYNFDKAIQFIQREMKL